MKKIINGKAQFVYEITTDHSFGDQREREIKKLYNNLCYICKKHNIDAELGYSDFHISARVVGANNSLSIVNLLENFMKEDKFELTKINLEVSIF